jgi:hypothetical protein
VITVKIPHTDFTFTSAYPNWLLERIPIPAASERKLWSQPPFRELDAIESVIQSTVLNGWHWMNRQERLVAARSRCTQTNL